MLLDSDYDFGSNRSSYPAQHPSMTPQSLNNIAKNTNNEVILKDVLRNDKCSTETIKDIFNKTYVATNMIGNTYIDINFDTIIYEVARHPNTDIELLNIIYEHLMKFIEKNDLNNSILTYGLSKNPNLTEELKLKLINCICTRRHVNYFPAALKNLGGKAGCFDSKI